jgi:hypothetical protein
MKEIFFHSGETIIFIFYEDTVLRLLFTYYSEEQHFHR